MRKGKRVLSIWRVRAWTKHRQRHGHECFVKHIASRKDANQNLNNL